METGVLGFGAYDIGRYAVKPNPHLNKVIMAVGGVNRLFVICARVVERKVTVIRGAYEQGVNSKSIRINPRQTLNMSG